MTVFISYSSADEPTARAVAAELEQAGHPTFLASRDIQPGHSYSAVIPSALRAADSVVLLLSDQAMESRHVQSEIDMAMSGGIPVLPVRLPGASDPMLIESWAYLLRHSQIAHWRGAPALVQWIGQLGSGVRSLRRSNRRRNRLILSTVSVAVVVILAVGGVFVIRGLRSETGTAGPQGVAQTGATSPTPTSPTPTSATTSAPTSSTSPAPRDSITPEPTGTGLVTTDPSSGPLVVSAGYAMQRGCKGTTALAMPAQVGSLASFHATSAEDLRTQLLKAGAGAWTEGTLELTLSATAGASIAVQSVDTHVVRTLPAPLWIEDPIADCGGSNAPARTFTFAPDVPTLIDAGLVNVGASGDTAAKAYDGISAVEANNLGTNFQLTGSTQGSIKIESIACSGNYEWSVDLSYTVAGDARPHKTTLGPYKTYGLAEGTTQIHGFPQADGSFDVQGQQQVNGKGCAFGEGRIVGVSLKVPSSHQPAQLADYVGGGDVPIQWNHLANTLSIGPDGTGTVSSGLDRDYLTATFTTALRSDGSITATVATSGGLPLTPGQSFTIAMQKGAGGPVLTAPDPRDPTKTLYFCQRNSWDQRCAEDSSVTVLPSATPTK